MSSAVLFLVVAIVASGAGSAVLWAVHSARQANTPDYRDQLRAIAPHRDHPPVEQPSGIVPLDPSGTEES